MFEHGIRTPQKQETHTIDTANVITFKLKVIELKSFIPLRKS